MAVVWGGAVMQSEGFADVLGGRTCALGVPVQVSSVVLAGRWCWQVGPVSVMSAASLVYMAGMASCVASMRDY